MSRRLTVLCVAATLLVLSALAVAACEQHVAGREDAGVSDDADVGDVSVVTDAEDAGVRDADEAADGGDADEEHLEADVEVEAEADIPPLDLTCEDDGTATTCPDEEECVTLGPCSLGCDESAGACYVPSNIPPELVGEATGDLDLSTGGSLVVIDTDTGEIAGLAGQIRDAVIGMDESTGTAFTVVEQPGGPELAVFSTGTFTVPAGVYVGVIGARPLVVAAEGAVTILGRIDAGAHGEAGGSGGFDGGAPGEDGAGDGGGRVGVLEQGCSPFCASGGGGGGFGGRGGDGGAVVWALGDESGTVAGGLGGIVYGEASLSPLVGGSGGAGGTLSEEDRPEIPGPGGGGGGAIQLVSAESVTIGDGGVIAVPGDGGGETLRGGGSGGGSGGAVLIEAPDVTISSLGVVAANGGGGSGGDCT